LALIDRRARSARRSRTWLAGGALAASLLAAALLLRGTGNESLGGPAVMQSAYDESAAPPLEILATDDEAFIAGDPEFYAWVDMDAVAATEGGNGHT
jgi:hypothetical protein